MDYKVIVIENEFLKVEVIDFAASVYQIYVKKNNQLLPVLSTPKTYDLFIENTLSYGRTIGRTAGRLHRDYESEQFVDFKDSLFVQHGGQNKFSTKTFNILNQSDTSVTLAYQVKDLEDDFKGNIDALVIYELDNDKLVVRHLAQTYSQSLCNMTFHPYFNLDQSNDLTTHELKVNSDTFLLQGPNGRFKFEKPVLGTHRDYLTSKSLVITEENKLDDIYLLTNELACTLKTKDITMNVYTNYDALVVFTQNKPTSTDLSNAPLGTLHSGIAIECQKPQSKLHILNKDEVYNFYTTYEFK